MAQDTPTNKDLALLLFSVEWSIGAGSEELEDATRRTFEKLKTHLSSRLGSAGYVALLKRALILARVDVPWLASVYVSENGVLEGFVAATQGRSITEASDGCVEILAQVIGLLETFIGKNLCLRVLHEVWPDSLRINIGG